ncbi:hypothetical protein L1049_004604 [Liquidambar formosana]|uniref:Uncharacterized protein n=1 Tax=Liquidambar formosana TaxID=63359 RepID=A0AAP0RPI8_LIQFO
MEGSCINTICFLNMTQRFYGSSRLQVLLMDMASELQLEFFLTMQQSNQYFVVMETANDLRRSGGSVKYLLSNWASFSNIFESHQLDFGLIDPFDNWTVP